jgi:hypothetical protein
LTGTKLWRLSLAAILGFGWLFLVPQNAWAACLNSYQTQTIAAAYEGDAEPTVHTIEACGGDDVSYQIPIATTINFDGVQYSSVYATTNSVITFGQPDNTYWDYPQTPSISLYSMDWVIYPSTAGWGRPDESMIINYSEGGFQINMNLRPIWMQSQPEPVNIVINAAITNTGGLAISYSTAFPTTGISDNYPGLRTGVRLHNGQVVSLESAGFYEVQNPETLQLSAAPVDESTYVPGQPEPSPSPTPEPTPMTPEEQQAAVVDATQLAADISNINNLIAAINGDEVEEPEVIPDPEPTIPVEPEIPTIEEPDVIVEPEIITPEDPRFPDGEEQTEPDGSNPSQDSDTTNEENATEDPTPEPSEEPASQPEDTDPTLEPGQDQPVDEEVVVEPSDNNSIYEGSAISEEELNKLNKLIAVNDAKLMSAVSELLTELSPEAKIEVAQDLGVKASEIQLIAEAVKNNPVLAAAVVEFSNRAEENENAPMPYTLADATTEIAAEQFLSDPIGALTNIDFEKILSPSEWGKDMTDDQREKAQEVIVPVIIASNIVAAAMTRRI